MGDFLKDNAQIISNLISTVAFLSSIVALYISVQQHIENHRAKLVFHVLQQDQTLWLLVQNIGEATACDIAVSLSDTVGNPVRSLRILPPEITYRYALMNIAQIEDHPDQFLRLSVQYGDVFQKSTRWNETYSFDILEILKYSCAWNEGQHCFDILPL